MFSRNENFKDCCQLLSWLGGSLIVFSTEDYSLPPARQSAKRKVGVLFKKSYMIRLRFLKSGDNAAEALVARRTKLWEKLLELILVQPTQQWLF